MDDFATQLSAHQEELPSGIVTFLFTDIEGSTQLWEEAPNEVMQSLTRHDEIIESEIANKQGMVVKPRGEGDSRFAVFEQAKDAVAAAAVIQKRFFFEQWSTPRPLKIRMALHTGEADLRMGDYYGPVVNRCARLRSIAHGGQTRALPVYLGTSTQLVANWCTPAR